jgi:monoamine oxidase
MLLWNELDHLIGGDCYMAVEGSNSGFSAIVEALAKPFKSQIRLSSSVKAIEYHGDEVRVSFSCGENARQVLAKHVIVTLPLGVLKANAVNFSPPLPLEKQMAIERLGNGICNKCVLFWDNDDFVVFWPKEKDWIVRLRSLSVKNSSEDAWLEFYNAYKYNGNKPVLIGYSGGRDASAIEHLTDEQVTQDAVASLQTIFGEDKVPEPTKSIVTRWEADEFSRGSFSFLAVGCTKQCREDLRESVGGKLFFAGEATESHVPSTTQGALISGENAACEVMEVFAANSSEQ